MPSAAQKTRENTLPEWVHSLRGMAFPDAPSFTKFLGLAGVSTTDLEFDPIRGEAHALGGKYSVYTQGESVWLTGYGVELLRRHSPLPLEEVKQHAHAGGALQRSLEGFRELKGELPRHSEFFYLEPNHLSNIPGVRSKAPAQEKPLPLVFKELEFRPAESNADFLMRAGGLKPYDTQIELLNRELGRRQLHLRALTEAMHKAGFLQYDAQEHFFLANLLTQQVLVSTPLITSSKRVASLHTGFGSQVPVSSSNNKDPYTYLNNDIFGFVFSFGFTGITSQSPGAASPQFCVSSPIIGIDSRLIREVKDLQHTFDSSIEGEETARERTITQKREPGEIFAEVIDFIKTCSTVGGHDHIHAMMTDLARRLESAPLFSCGVDKQIEKTRTGFNGGFGNETNATIAQAVSFIAMNAVNPDIKLALLRQGVKFFDNVAELHRQGLSLNGAAYLLFLGLAHLDLIWKLDEKLPGTDSSIVDLAGEKSPYMERELSVRLSELLQAHSLARAHLTEIPAAQGVIKKSRLNFGDPNLFTPSHCYYHLKALNDVYTILKAFDGRTIPEEPDGESIFAKALNAIKKSEHFKADPVPVVPELKLRSARARFKSTALARGRKPSES